MQVNLDGKVAFITGSTGGIGKAVALKFARNGADLVINGRTSEAAQGLIKEITEIGRKVIFEEADISNYQEIETAVQNALKRFGKIDILVVSGGVRNTGVIPRFFHETDPADYFLIVKMQYFSRLFCIKAVLNHMIERQTGKIIMITTDAGRWPTPSESVIGGAGAAVILSTKVLAKELARWQIRVNAIGMTFIEDTPGKDYTTQMSQSIAHVSKRAIEKRPFSVTMDDIADACLFLVSNEADGITGQILSVNGGLCFP